MAGKGKMTRRGLLRLAATSLGAVAVAACAPKVIEKVVKETVIVEGTSKVVEKVVKETVIVAGTPKVVERVVKETVVVEKVVEATPAPKEKVTIEYWYGADTPEQIAIYTDSVAKFEEEFVNIGLKAELVSWPDSFKKTMAAWAAGTGLPDTSMVDSGRFIQFWNMGMLVLLDERFKEWKSADDMLDSVRELSRPQPGAPIAAMTNLVLVNYIYYRPDLLAEANLEVPDTNDEFLEAAKALNNPPALYGYAMRGGDGGHWGHLHSILKGNGLDLVLPDGTVDLDSPEGIESVAWFVSLHTKHKVTPPSAPADSWPEIFGMYQGGQAAFMQHGLWSWKAQADALGDKASAMQFPRGKKTRWADTGMNGNVIFKTCPHQDEAWEWIAFMAEPYFAKRMSRERGSPATLKSLQDDPFYEENRFFKAAMDCAPYWGSGSNWYVNWPKFKARWPPEFQRALKEEITPEELCRITAEVLRKG